MWPLRKKLFNSLSNELLVSKWSSVKMVQLRYFNWTFVLIVILRTSSREFPWMMKMHECRKWSSFKEKSNANANACQVKFKPIGKWENKKWKSNLIHRPYEWLQYESYFETLSLYEKNYSVDVNDAKGKNGQQ